MYEAKAQKAEMKIQPSETERLTDDYWGPHWSPDSTHQWGFWVKKNQTNQKKTKIQIGILLCKLKLWAWGAIRVFCCTPLCPLLSALLLPSLQAACSAADFHISLVSACCCPPSSVLSAGFLTLLLSYGILILLLDKLLILALPLSSLSRLHLSPAPFPFPPPPPTARILQEGRLLPDNAKAPGGENSQGWALSVQSGFSVRGLTEKVLDHKLDGDAAISLLRPFSFGTLMHSLSRWFDVDLKKTSGLGQDSRTTGPVHGSAVDSVSFFLFLF